MNPFFLLRPKVHLFHPSHRFIPHLEILEQRLQPGEGILGSALLGLSLGELNPIPDISLTDLMATQRDLEQNVRQLQFSPPSAITTLLTTPRADDLPQPPSIQPLPIQRSPSPAFYRWDSMFDFGTSPSALSNGRVGSLDSGSWQLTKPTSPDPQIQVNQPTNLPQVFSIDMANVKPEPSGIIRRITTPTSHLANLHVVHHSVKSGKSQLGIQDTTLEFLTTFGGPGEDAGKGIVVDEKGNSYVTGYYDTRDPNQGTDVFVAKLDPTGKNLIWFITFGGPGRDEGHGIARDQKGNLYIVGTIDTGDPDRGTDAFVAKLDADGNFIYQPLLIEGPGNDSGNGITVNDVGEAYITGVLRESGSSYHALIAKIQADGSDVVYAIEDSPSGRNSIGNGIGVDAKGNIYIAGQLDGLYPRVFKYNAGDGTQPPTFAWGYYFFHSERDAGSGNNIVVAPDGTYYWAGDLPSHRPLQFYSLIGKGGPAGISDFVYCTGNSANSRGFGVGYDAEGNGYLAGSWNVTGTTAFLDEFDPNGRYILNHLALQQGTLAAYSMVFDNSKPNLNAYLTGTLDTRNPDEGIDAFVAKVSFQ